MRKNLLNLTTILIGAMLLASCSKDENSSDGKVAYKVKPSNFSASVASDISGSGLSVAVNSNSSITWTSGILNISEIDFEAEGNGKEIEYELKNQFNVDLLNLSPILGSINIPTGTYHEVELKLELEPSTTKIPLTLKGTYTNTAGIKTPVEFYFNEEFEIEVEAEDVTVNGSEDYVALINLQLNKFLSNVSTSDLDQATKTNGAIIISDTSNINLYNKFKSNLNAFGECDFDD